MDALQSPIEVAHDILSAILGRTQELHVIESAGGCEHELAFILARVFIFGIQPHLNYVHTVAKPCVGPRCSIAEAT